MTSTIDQMTQLYGFVDDALKASPQVATWRSSPNARPAFTDAGVLPIALMQDYLGVASRQQTYNLIAENFPSAFPQVCSYSSWFIACNASTRSSATCSRLGLG